MRRGTAPLATMLGLLVLTAQAGAGAAPEWPQFHGPRRDNISDETGFLKRWPQGGPKKLWTAKGIGHGFSTVAIAGGLIYTTGNIGTDTVITALDLEGKMKWTVKNGPAWTGEVKGTRGTPTIDEGCLYHQNAHGDVVCLEARTGRRIWSVNILKKFGGRNIRWGLSESLLIDGNRVICVPGGTAAGVVALDKMTGETVWVCKDTDDKPGYASPVVVEHGGVRQVVTMMARSVVGVHAGTGKLLWRHRHRAAYDENVLTPIFHDGCVFVSTLRPAASRLIRLTVVGDAVTAETAWQTRALDNHHGGVLLLEGHLYGSTTRGRWVCLDFGTGKPMYTADGVGKGSLTYADGMLYTYSQNRVMGLVKATPTGHEVISHFKIPPGGRGPSWAHPVVCGGRLYLRYDDFLHCYDIRQR